jgi:ASC-1-like (ASCH) protein
MEEIFVQHRDREPFENIRDGIKKMEIRLNDLKRQGIKLGMKIKIVSRENDNDFLFTRVIGLSRFGSFDDLYKVMGDKIKDYEREILGRVYSEEKVKEFGVLVIHFELV